MNLKNTLLMNLREEIIKECLPKSIKDKYNTEIKNGVVYIKTKSNKGV